MQRGGQGLRAGVLRLGAAAAVLRGEGVDARGVEEGLQGTVGVVVVSVPALSLDMEHTFPSVPGLPQIPLYCSIAPALT